MLFRSGGGTGNGGGGAAAAVPFPTHSSPQENGGQSNWRPSEPPKPAAASSRGAAANPRGAGRERYPQPPPSDLEALKLALGYSTANSVVRTWWGSVEEKNISHPRVLIDLLQQIYRRKMSLGEFHLHYEKTGLGNGSKNLNQVLKEIDLQLLEKDKNRIGWETCSYPARQWWDAFQAANASDLLTVRELIDELAKRNVSADDFFGVYVHSGASSMVELLREIDALVASRNASAIPGGKPPESNAVVGV